MKVEELQERLSRGEQIQLLDVREREEYEAGEHIADTENMPMGKVFLEAAKGRLPKDRKIVTICKSGTRCEIVARELQKSGYDIDYLEGGITAWQESK